jgi:hypothetical protein
MKAPGLPADQQFFADLFSGLVLNPQLLGRVWFASQPASLPVGSLCIDFPRLDIVLRGEYGNLLEAKQQRLVEGEMLFIPARAANLPVNNKPVMLLSLVFAPTWLGLSFYDSRTTSLLHPARQIQLPSLQRGEGEAMLTALTHLSRSPLEQNIIQPLVLSLLHLCRSVVNMPPSHFFRCHRSFCVNLNKIREIEPWFNNTYILRLKDLDFEVPVSRSKVKEFRQLMHL